MYPDISTSLKVVSNAFVFYACFKFSAIFNLILVIGTRVSSLCPLIVVGAFFAVVVAVPDPAPEAAAGAFYGVTGGGGGGVAAFAGSGAALAGSAAFGSSFGAAALGAAGADPPFASVSRV